MLSKTGGITLGVYQGPTLKKTYVYDLVGPSNVFGNLGLPLFMDKPLYKRKR